MIKKDIRKTYWGLLKYEYTKDDDNKSTDVFMPEVVLCCCCCPEEGYILYNTKKEALKNRRGEGWQR